MTHDPDVDVQYMQQALELARGGLGFVSPNPLVGCVLVKDGVSWAGVSPTLWGSACGGVCVAGGWPAGARGDAVRQPGAV